MATDRLRRRVRRVALAVSWASVLLFVAVMPLRPRLGDGLLLAVDAGLFNVAYAGAAVALAVPSRTAPARERWGWRAFGLGLVGVLAGSAYYSVVLADLPEIPYPSVADAFYLAFFPLAYAGILLVLTARVGRPPASVWLDGIVVGSGVGALAAAAAFAPLLETSPTESPVVVATNLAYPLGDLLLLVVLVGVGYATRSGLTPRIALLGAGLAVTCVADVLGALQMIDETYVEGGWLDVAWMVGAALCGTAVAARGRTAEVDAVDLVTERGGSLRVVAVPLTAAAVSLALLGIGQGSRFPAAAGILAALCILAAGGRAALTFRDVVQMADLRRQALTDDLTLLPNRRSLYESIDTATAAARVDGSTTSLLLLDLDGFKEVNDTLGHSAGDQLLVAFGERVRQVLGPRDILARLGGDEFAVLCPGADAAEAWERAWAAVRAARQEFHVDGISVTVDVSVGIACAAGGGVERSDLLRQADIAMYRAKGTTDRVASFDAAVESADGLSRLELLTRLRQGLGVNGPDRRHGRVEVHLQPKIDLRTGGVTGLEALARWRDAGGALLPPAQFMPLVQRAGLLHPLAAAVLDASLEAGAALRAAGWELPVSVNLSAVDVHDTDLAARVAAALHRTGTPPSGLVLELTEESVMADPGRVAGVLADVRSLGVRVSLDDFGTGYSSLAYLRRLPVDEVKLDRTFTVDLLSDPAAAAVVRHTCGLVHALGLSLVAEGIEDAETARVLAELGCDQGQGFFWYRPMPLGALLAALPPRTPAMTVVHAGPALPV
jgi:diguanylate cyclase